MKEQFSMNKAGHMMSEPRSLADLVEVLARETRETRAHREGVTNQNRQGGQLLHAAGKFVEAVPHAPLTRNAEAATKAYVACVQEYHEGMAMALEALRQMRDVAETALGELEAANAMRKQQSARAAR